MSTQIEARRLSGEHVGRAATVPDRTIGTLKVIEHRFGSVHLWVRPLGVKLGTSVLLAPTDLVTIHDDRTTTPTPKETP